MAASVQRADEEIELEEARVFMPDISTESRSVQFSSEGGEELESLTEAERDHWREVFSNLDLLDNKRDGAVCITALAKVLDRLENRNNIFFFRRQTERKINR